MNKVVYHLCGIAMLPLLTACHEMQDTMHYHNYNNRYYDSSAHVQLENYNVHQNRTVRNAPPPPRTSVHHAPASRGAVQHGHVDANEKVVVNPDPNQAHVEVEKNQHGHADKY